MLTSTYRAGVNARSVLNVKAVVSVFNREKALLGAFSVIVKTECETDGDGSYAAYFRVAAGRQEVSFICYMKFIFYAYT